MILPEIYELAALFRTEGVRYWVCGGVGVELAVGEAIRGHKDIDVFVASSQCGRAAGALRRAGFVWHKGSVEDGNVFFDRGQVVVDVVPIDDSTDPPRTLGPLAACEWPAGFLDTLTVEGSNGRVDTLRPQMHAAMKGIVRAYYGLAEMRPEDLIDLEYLHKAGAGD
ncbi:MAG: hypothetical protein KJ077_34755 [Anaerolineae bacterium]|nr:hypothetical protein [Anaerolineae bacterium]